MLLHRPPTSRSFLHPRTLAFTSGGEPRIAFKPSSDRSDGDARLRKSSGDGSSVRRSDDERTPRRSFDEASSPRSSRSFEDKPRFGGSRSFGGSDSRPRFGGSDSRDSRPRFGGEDSKPRFGGSDSRPRFGGEDSKPRFGGSDSRPRFGGENAKPRWGDYKPRFGGEDSKPRWSDSKPRFGGEDFKPRWSDSKPRFGGEDSRPRYDDGKSSSAPRRSFGEGDARPPQRYGDNTETRRRPSEDRSTPEVSRKTSPAEDDFVKRLGSVVDDTYEVNGAEDKSAATEMKQRRVRSVTEEDGQAAAADPTAPRKRAPKHIRDARNAVAAPTSSTYDLSAEGGEDGPNPLDDLKKRRTKKETTPTLTSTTSTTSEEPTDVAPGPDKYEASHGPVLELLSKENEFLFGKNVVRVALRWTDPRVLQQNARLILQDGCEMDVQDIAKLAREKNIKVEVSTKMRMNNAISSQTSPHQGVLLEMPRTTHTTIKKDTAVIVPEESAKHNLVMLALDQITDPMNLGPILRTANFFGVFAVLTSERNSCPITPTVTKTSAGATLVLSAGGRLLGTKNLTKSLESHKAVGWRVVGTMAEDEEVVEPAVTAEAIAAPTSDESSDLVTRAKYAPKPILSIDDLPPHPRTIVVMGSEGSGLRTNIREMCDVLIHVPRPKTLAPPTARPNFTPKDASVVEEEEKIALNVSAACAATLARLNR